MAQRVVLTDDLDGSEATQTVNYTIDGHPLPVHNTAVPNLQIVPSHILVSNADMELTTAIDHREARLKTELEKISGQYDVVIIDCPPTLSWLTINAFTASDSVIVAVSPGYFELDSIVQLTKTIGEVRDYFNPAIQLRGFLFTMADPTINSTTSLRILRQTYTKQVFNTVIPRNVDIRDAHFNKKDIITFNPRSKAAHAYNKLIDELFPNL